MPWEGLRLAGSLDAQGRSSQALSNAAADQHWRPQGEVGPDTPPGPGSTGTDERGGPHRLRGEPGQDVLENTGPSRAPPLLPGPPPASGAAQSSARAPLARRMVTRQPTMSSLTPCPWGLRGSSLTTSRAPHHVPTLRAASPAPSPLTRPQTGAHTPGPGPRGHAPPSVRTPGSSTLNAPHLHGLGEDAHHLRKFLSTLLQRGAFRFLDCLFVSKASHCL